MDKKKIIILVIVVVVLVVSGYFILKDNKSDTGSSAKNLLGIYDIMYIAPRVSDPSLTEVRYFGNQLDTKATIGSRVKLKGTDFDGTYTVKGKWISPDNGGTVFIDTPWRDVSGERNSLGLPINYKKGTMSLV
jgi:hypothetical protein